MRVTQLLSQLPVTSGTSLQSCGQKATAGGAVGAVWWCGTARRATQVGTVDPSPPGGEESWVRVKGQQDGGTAHGQVLEGPRHKGTTFGTTVCGAFRSVGVTKYVLEEED